MGVRLSYDGDGNVVIQPESYKNGDDSRLVTYLDDLIRQDIKQKAAREKGDGVLEKTVATITRPDGTRTALSKPEAIKALADSAEVWGLRALEPGLDPDVKAYLLAKSRLAKNEINRLEGREVQEAEPVIKQARPVSFTLPR